LFSFYRSPADAVGRRGRRGRSCSAARRRCRRRGRRAAETEAVGTEEAAPAEGCRWFERVTKLASCCEAKLLSLARRSAKLLEAGAAAGTAAVEKELRSVDALAAKCGMQSRTATWSARRASCTAPWDDHAHCL